MGQAFWANPATRRAEPNGAVSFAPGGPFDCVGHWAKVANCPIEGTSLRLTCYATGYADTFFSVPACTRYRGRYVAGFFTSRDDGPVFVPAQRHWERIGAGRTVDTDAGSLTLKRADYLACSAPGRAADGPVSDLVGQDYVREQMRAIDPDRLRAYLKGFGAWDAAELADHAANVRRFVWSCCNDAREADAAEGVRHG